MPDATRRIALVTGANKGIGFETARQISRTGVFVLLGARNPELGRQAEEKLKAEGLEVRYLKLDLNDRASIDAAAESIASEFGHLDILVNNAGIIVQGDGMPGKASLESVEQTLRTNFLGAVAVTQAMLPLLHKSSSARIVNVSSGLGSLAINSDPSNPYAEYKYLGYSASKAALNMFTAQLAYELRNTGIKVNASDPGYTATNINNNSGPQTIEEGSEETIRLALLPEDGPTGTYSDRHGVVPW